MLRLIFVIAVFIAVGGRVTPQEAEPTTKDHLRLNVPNFFFWEYTFEPEPGKRIWLRVDDKTFVERYPSGKENKFSILGRFTVEKTSGTLVQIQGGKLQAFVPDKDSEQMFLKMRADETNNWGHMGEMKKIE